MSDRLLSMTVDATLYPERGLLQVMEHSLRITGLTRVAVLILERSDTHPTYTIVASRANHPHDPPICSLDGGHGEWFASNTEVLGLSTLTPSNLKSLGSRLFQFFPGHVLSVPIPGKRFISLSETSGEGGSGTAGIILIGPFSKVPMKLNVATWANALSALSAVAGNCIRELQSREALEICTQVMAKFRPLDPGSTVLDLGRVILDAVQDAVPFEAGVLYLRDLKPGFDRYLIFAAAVGESRDTLLKSYWCQAEKGATWRVMENRSPAAGTATDLGRVGAKRTNTRAFEAALPPEDIHKAWTVIPFIHGNEPVAVAHLEGVNRLQGLSRSQLEALTLMARLLGSVIHNWRTEATRDRQVMPDIDLIAELNEIIPPPQLSAHKSRYLDQPEREFERLVMHALRHCLGVADVTSRYRSIIKATFNRDQKPDGVITLSGHKNVVVEVTLKEDPNQAAGLVKLRQLADYLDYVDNAVGLLVVGGEWKVDRCGPHKSKTIWIMDRARLERFCSLSPKTRTDLLSKWAREQAPGIGMCDCQE